MRIRLRGFWIPVCMILLVMISCAGCSDTTPIILPDTANYMPPELKNIYLGMEKSEVDRFFTVQSTHLTNRGLETATQFVRDSIQIGVAFAYRDGRVATATIWYDYQLVPARVDSERVEFLKYLIERNGGNYEPCSFILDEGKYVPDIGLIWKRPGCFVTSMFSKPSHTFPDTMSFRPYYQFSIFDSTITPWHLWRNILIPAHDSERRFFREVDSLRMIMRTQQTE